MTWVKVFKYLILIALKYQRSFSDSICTEVLKVKVQVNTKANQQMFSQSDGHFLALLGVTLIEIKLQAPALKFPEGKTQHDEKYPPP